MFANMLSDSVDKFKRLTKHPERFLQAQHDAAEEIKDLLKTVYDFTKKQEGLEKNLNALPKLVIKEFDDEQIWQELELQNSAKYTKFILDVPRLLASRDKLNAQVASEGSDLEDDCNDYLAEIETGPRENDNDLEFDNGEEDYEENEINKKNAKEKSKTQPSIVDDKFFKLSQLEEFLDKEDRKENHKYKSKQYDDNDDSEDSIDLFNDVPSDENEMEEGGAHYGEFFDAPEDGEEQIGRKRKRNRSEINGEEDLGNDKVEEDENDELDEYDGGDDKLVEALDEKNEKQVRFDLSPASSTDSDSEDSSKGKKKKDDAKRAKSSFETRQERLQERIKSLEEKALAEKAWQMKGEVSSTTRPQNSLLEEVLEYDLATRPAPVMTEQTTLKLEDIIRQRIKDKSWDDVERKVKPTVAPDEYKKKLVMDHEKSKFSLAEIYEQEYLKQKEAQDPNNDEKPEEEPEEHRTIRAMTSSLFAKLDALTNFHYTPKPIIPEVKIISNLPAITMEEVAPVAVNDATLLAPEEVKAKQKGDLVGKEERTETDRKRERRKKKQLQRIKQKEKEKREKIVEKLNPGLGNKYSKEKALRTLEKLSSDKNVHQLEDEGKDKGVRSSTAFFNQLQEEVVGQIKGKSKESKKKEKEKFSAKKMKL